VKNGPTDKRIDSRTDRRTLRQPELLMPAFGIYRRWKRKMLHGTVQ